MKRHTRFTSLSEAEIWIVTDTSHGLTAAEMGRKRGIGSRMVETHQSNILKKLGFTTIPQLCYEWGLVMASRIGEAIAKPKLPHYKDPLDAISSVSGFTIHQIVSKARQTDLAWARAMASVIYREQGLSLSQIGEILGGRDHTTIMNSLRAHRETLINIPLYKENFRKVCELVG